MGSSLAVRLAPERIASSTEANIFQNTAPGLENTNHSNHTYSLRSVLSGTHHEEISASWQNDCEGNVACLQPDAWSLSCGIHTMGWGSCVYSDLHSHAGKSCDMFTPTQHTQTGKSMRKQNRNRCRYYYHYYEDYNTDSTNLEWRYLRVV